MPSDTFSNSLDLLDVQFGSLEFGSDSALTVTDYSLQEKSNTSNVTLNSSSNGQASVPKTLNSTHSYVSESTQNASDSAQYVEIKNVSIHF